MEPDDGICLSALLLEVDVDPAGVVAGFESATGTVPRSGSNLSQLSLASNASTPTPSRHVGGGSLTLDGGSLPLVALW